jgi:hypothetical protein
MIIYFCCFARAGMVFLSIKQTWYWVLSNAGNKANGVPVASTEATGVEPVVISTQR